LQIVDREAGNDGGDLQGLLRCGHDDPPGCESSRMLSATSARLQALPCKREQ
jgi:hypothetical protein